MDYAGVLWVVAYAVAVAAVVLGALLVFWFRREDPNVSTLWYAVAMSPGLSRVIWLLLGYEV